MLYRFLHIVIISLLFLPVCGYGQTPSSPDSTVYKIKFLPVNTTTSDYCAVPYHNGIVFCSARKSINGVSYYSERSQNSMSHLYYSEYLTHSRLSKPKAFAKTFSSKYNEGPVCFDDNFSTIFFTTNINPTVKLQDQKKDLYTLKIFKAKMVNNEWVNVQGLPFNSDRYNVGHPSLSHDGTKLFFISDMPGGYGGTDLYMVINNEGSWSKPINLGPGVNTRGNEMFPFMGHDGRLYFSSDGHPGYGKLDVFTAELINGKWGLTKNLGEPINSNDDDFGFYLEKNGFTGYFTSNRSGGIDNIYRYERMNKSCETVPDIDFCFTFFEKNAIFGEDLPMAYEWNLGDGTKKRGSEISHCFDKSGKYKIQLNIIDSITGVIFYNEATYSITVNEINRPYIEIIGGTASGKTMELDAARSVLAHCKIQDYLWDFGDGYTALGERVVHKYPQEGSYEVYLNVSGISEITGGECNSCVKKRIEVKNAPIIADSASHVSSVAETLYNPNDKDDVVYKVQVTSSDTPISIDSDQFKVLDQEVTEFFDRGFYGYTVGDENDLLSAYPLFMDVREKGFEEARVVAFKDGKIVSGDDTTNLRKVQGTAVTFISGRIINRFGDPIPATLYLEDLTNGKRLAVFTSDSTFGRYEIKLLNDRLYGFYAEYPGHYSISNNIDLRNEHRSLEVKKNIEMIAYENLVEENVAIRLNNIFFGSNEFQLQKESYTELERLSDMIKQNKKIKVEISGHTDNTNTYDFNMDLSQKRANSVKEYLLSQGVKKNQIIAKGYGYTKPLVSNNTERGRYLNRRVEFRFIFD